MKSFLSSAVRKLRLGFKQRSGSAAALLGSKSYPLFGLPTGLAEMEIARVVVPKESFELPLPKSIERDLLWCFRDRRVELPELGVFRLQGGVATHLGGYLTSRGKLVTTYLKSVDGKAAANHDLFNFSHKRFFPRMAREESVISLVAGRQDMFYHWMYEVLPRFALIQGIEGKIYIDQGQRFQRESLALLGIDPERIIDASQFQGVQAEELIVPAIPPLPTRWSCDFLRAHIQVEREGKRRLYLSRKDAAKRRVLNEEELLPILEREGFEVATTSSLPFAEQVKLFASAEIVVGPHGAGFSPLTFCKPGTSVLELFSPAYSHRCYWQVAAAAGLPYHYLLGEGEHYPDSVESPRDPDFAIDPKKFEEALRHLIADR